MCTLLISSSLALASKPEVLEIGEQFEIDSKIMGEKRTVMVHLPNNYRINEQRYPVLYLTDGAGHLHHTSGTVQFLANNGRMPSMIVVAVTNTERTRDLTPTPAAGRDDGGGADRFLRFFTDELVPHIEKHYRTYPYRVFAGHSFGGLFAVNAFLSQPDSFDAFVAVSPSLWWDDRAMIKKAETFFTKNKKLDKHLYLTLGDEGERMQVPYDAFIKVLEGQKAKGFHWDSKLFPDEDHGSVVLRSHYFAFKSVFESWQAPEDARDLDSLMAHYKQLSKRVGFEMKVPEARVNNLGYRALFNDEVDKAISIFKWNVTHYASSANVYDSLGEALEKAGKLTEARANYKTAWKRAQKTKDPAVEIFKTNYERVSAELKKAKSGS